MTELRDINRKSRANSTRDAEARREPWKPSGTLPIPNREDGYAYRWIRTSTLAQPDIRNASSKFREGWVPVKASDHPELMLKSDEGSKYPDGVEVGGLLLCKNSVETVNERKAYYEKLSEDQLRAVDNTLFSVNDPRMPLSKPERRTRVSKGPAPESET